MTKHHHAFRKRLFRRYTYMEFRAMRPMMSGFGLFVWMVLEDERNLGLLLPSIAIPLHEQRQCK